MGEGDGDVGEDGGGVGVDCGDDDDGHGSVPVPPGEKGRGGPFVFFFLDLLPRWEKGFPSGPWLPWHGRGESPSEIGSISLSLSVSAFSDSALSPFHASYLTIMQSNMTMNAQVMYMMMLKVAWQYISEWLWKCHDR